MEGAGGDVSGAERQPSSSRWSSGWPPSWRSSTPSIPSAGGHIGNPWLPIPVSYGVMRLLLPLVTLALLAAACGSGSGDTTPDPSHSPVAASPSPANHATRPIQVTAPPARVTPTPQPGPLSGDAPLYIALGDSLSYGAGASDRFRTAFVPLVHESLPPETGLLNLGHSGDTSAQLMQHGHLDWALSEITRRNGDGDPGNDVVLVTLEIGGNDLLDLFFDYVVPGICPTLVGVAPAPGVPRHPSRRAGQVRAESQGDP